MGKSNPFGALRQKTVKFHLRDVATALVHLAELHEGLWQIQMVFGNSAANLNLNEHLMPCAITAVAGLQLARVEEVDELTVDAAVVNPHRPLIVPVGLAVN